MTKTYLIPKEITYEIFANIFIQQQLHLSNYVKQYCDNGKTYIIISDNNICSPPCITNSEHLPSLMPIKSDTKQASQICFSIRCSELAHKELPFEYIAKRIITYPYTPNRATIYTDQYGIEYLIIY